MSPKLCPPSELEEHILSLCAYNFCCLFLSICSYAAIISVSINIYYSVSKGSQDGPLVGFMSAVLAGLLQVVTYVHPTKEQLVPLEMELAYAFPQHITIFFFCGASCVL